MTSAGQGDVYAGDVPPDPEELMQLLLRYKDLREAQTKVMTTMTGDFDYVIGPSFRGVQFCSLLFQAFGCQKLQHMA